MGSNSESAYETWVTEAPAFDAFLSYASADILAVRRLAGWLRGAGFRPWLDEEQLVPGALWQFGLQRGIEQSRAVICWLGPAYASRYWTGFELQLFTLRQAQGGCAIMGLTPPGFIEQAGLHAVLALSQRVPWASAGSDPDLEAMWRLACGLQGRAPGPQPQWESEGRRLLGSSAVALPSPASEGDILLDVQVSVDARPPFGARTKAVRTASIRTWLSSALAELEAAVPVASAQLRLDPATVVLNWFAEREGRGVRLDARRSWADYGVMSGHRIELRVLSL